MNAVEKAPIPATKKMVEFSISRNNPDTPSSESQVNHETEFSDGASEAIAIKKPATKNRRRDDPLSRGVHQRKNGKWSTEISSGKSRIWLGTFGTKEEARRAYLSKKMEIEASKLSGFSGGGYGSKTVIESKKLSWSAKRLNVETGEELTASSRSAQGCETSDDNVGSGDRAGEAPAKNWGLDDSSSRGVYQRKSGKWSAEFRSGKSRISLGTFGTKEEARRAYLSKKMEVEGPEPSSRSRGGGYGWPEKPKGNNIQGTGEKPAASSCWVQAFGTSDQARVKSKTKSQRPYPGVFYRLGKWSAEVWNPFKKRKMWLGTFKSPEEAWAAIVGKKQEFDAMRLNLEKELFRHTDPSGGESNLATEDSTPAKGVTEEPECSGESSEVTILKRFTEGIGRHDIDYIMKIASHIIDSYGNFLGEFSYIDDLQIR